MSKIDFKKGLRDLYNPRYKEVVVIDVLQISLSKIYQFFNVLKSFTNNL
jgi:hypothetical protein